MEVLSLRIWCCSIGCILYHMLELAGNGALRQAARSVILGITRFDETRLLPSVSSSQIAQGFPTRLTDRRRHLRRPCISPPPRWAYLSQAILAVLIAGYFVARLLPRRASRPAHQTLLTGFFVCTALLTLLFTLDASFSPSDRLAPLYLETTVLALGILLLLQFAYRFPQPVPHEWEARLALALSLAYRLADHTGARGRVSPGLPRPAHAALHTERGRRLRRHPGVVPLRARSGDESEPARRGPSCRAGE